MIGLNPRRPNRAGRERKRDAAAGTAQEGTRPDNQRNGRRGMAETMEVEIRCLINVRRETQCGSKERPSGSLALAVPGVLACAPAVCVPRFDSLKSQAVSNADDALSNAPQLCCV